MLSVVARHDLSVTTYRGGPSGGVSISFRTNPLGPLVLTASTRIVFLPGSSHWLTSAWTGFSHLPLVATRWPFSETTIRLSQVASSWAVWAPPPSKVFSSTHDSPPRAAQIHRGGGPACGVAGRGSAGSAAGGDSSDELAWIWGNCVPTSSAATSQPVPSRCTNSKPPTTRPKS